MSRANIFAVIKDKGLLTPLKVIMEDLSRNDHYKYCKFHKVSGHGTADCIDLKKQVKWLVQNKCLKKYVNNKRRDERKCGDNDHKRADYSRGFELFKEEL